MLSVIYRRGIATFRLKDITIGQSISFEQEITENEIDRFADLSGDASPLHMDATFARSRGFRTRVAHGMLLAGYASRLFGIYLPGRDCLLHSINLKWISPAYVGERVRLTATVKEISHGAAVMVADVTIENAVTGTVLAKGKAQIGFTG